MPQNEILIHFEQTQHLLSQLIEDAQALIQETEQIGTQAQAVIKNGWMSEGADLAIRREENLIEEVRQSAMTIQSFAENVRQMLDRIHHAEQENVLLAQTRTYG